MFLGQLRAEEGNSSIVWLKKYETALKQSQLKNKPLLIYFTASDWSGWCMKLKKEVLDTESFQQALADKVICLEVDFPFYLNLTEEEIEHNHLLKEKFAITEYPRMVLVSVDERVLTKVGYMPGGGEKVALHFLKVLGQDKKLSEIIPDLEETSYSLSKLEKYYKRARELQREKDAEKILACALKKPNPLFFLFEKYRLHLETGHYDDDESVSLRKELLALDEDNKKGVHFSLALIDFQELSNKESTYHDPKLVIRPLEEYIAKFGHIDSENTWRVEMMIAQFYLDYDDNKTALKHAVTAFESAPETKKPTIKRSLDYIRKQVR